jgi:hypothetical protein
MEKDNWRRGGGGGSGGSASVQHCVAHAAAAVTPKTTHLMWEGVTARRSLVFCGMERDSVGWQQVRSSDESTGSCGMTGTSQRHHEAEAGQVVHCTWRSIRSHFQLGQHC